MTAPPSPSATLSVSTTCQASRPASLGKTVLHYNVTNGRFGIIALGTCIAERRWGLAGDLHSAVRHEPLLGHRDGLLARALLAQIGVGGFSPPQTVLSPHRLLPP
jgi:hypothetical protein